MATKTKAKAATGERREHFETSSGLELPVDFNPSNTVPVEYDRDLGGPGDFPYTRGIRRNLYRGRLWTMRQYAGYASATESNARYKYLLAQGTTGLSVAFALLRLALPMKRLRDQRMARITAPGEHRAVLREDRVVRAVHEREIT